MVFHLLLNNHSQDRHNSLRRWLAFLQDETFPHRRRVIEVIRSGHVPSHILHTFACDSATQALHRLESLHGLQPQMHQLLDEKRRWIEGEIDDQQLAKTRSLARDTLFSLWERPLAQQLINRILRATSEYPDEAARYSSRPQDEQESQWQSQRLYDLILQFFHQRQVLLQTLHKFVQSQKPLRHWQRESEDALFH